MKNKYKNLWYKTLNIKRPEYYENDAKEVGYYRGVAVYKLFDRGYDFVIGGACIAQRAGASDIVKTIDSILDGEEAVSSEVTVHLRGLGFRALSYEEADKLEGETV